MKYRYLIIFLYFWLQNEKQYTHFYMNLVIYLFIYFPQPTPHFWGLKTSKNQFFLKIFIFNFSFWRKVLGLKKKALVLCNGRVMAIWIFACYESRHSLVLLWWVLLRHRFYNNSRMWEGEVNNICSGATTPHTEASLVKSIWKGLGGFLPTSDFLFFWW
jgi:hypothetical protein